MGELLQLELCCSWREVRIKVRELLLICGPLWKVHINCCLWNNAEVVENVHFSINKVFMVVHLI